MARSVARLVLGGCAAIGLVFVAAGAQTEPSQTLPGTASKGLITHIVPSADGPTQLIVVDPLRLVVSVYHIVRESGEIQLKSVRPIDADLELSEFNSTNPRPDDVRSMIQRQR